MSMQQASFNCFFKQYKWLFGIASAIPTIGIAEYCLAFWNRAFDENIWATIVTSCISYIGTVAWGIFIYYDGWRRQKEQEYRDFPRIKAGCVPKNKDQAVYTYEEVCGRPITQAEKTTELFFYLKFRVYNMGNHALFNFRPKLILVYVNYKGDAEQKPQHFVNLTKEIISFRESSDLFIGVMKDAIGWDPQTINTTVTYVFSFQDDLMKIYYCRCVIPIYGGKKQFQDDLHIYTEKEYNALMARYEQIKDSCQFPYSQIFGL